MNDRLKTPEELAQKLNVHKSWVYARTRESGPDAMPRVRVGKYVRFEESKVMEWLERQNVKE
jgi:excisionase family DNA binding protein